MTPFSPSPLAFTSENSSMAYPKHIMTTYRASYWQLGPERFNAFPRDTTLEQAKELNKGGGYAYVESIMKLKGDNPAFPHIPPIFG